MKTNSEHFRKFCHYAKCFGIELKLDPKKFGYIILKKDNVIHGFEFPNDIADVNILTSETLPDLFGIASVVLFPLSPWLKPMN